MSGRHIAIVAPPVPGHYDPLKVLALALEVRGHRVTFVHMADAGALVPGYGFEPVGAQTHGSGALRAYTDILARAARPAGFFAMIRATAAITDMLLGELPDALGRIGADAVIADSTEPAGGLVARHLGLPWATSVTGLPLLSEPAVPPPFIGWRYRDDEAGLRRNATGYRIADWLSRPITRVVRRRAETWGLDPDAHGGFSPALQVAQCPPSLDFLRRELPPTFYYTGPWRAPRTDGPDLPSSDRPLIYCSLGSLQGDRPKLFAAMTEACARIGARALVAHGGRLDSMNLPGEPIVRAHWDQPATLPHCAAAILHGGFNTVLDSLAAGVPMLVRPLAFEQPGTAARIVHHRLGHSLTGRAGVGRIARALQKLIDDDDVRRSTARMAAEMAGLGGVERAADLVDDLFRRA